MGVLKFQKYCFLLFLTVNAEDLFCTEDGGLRGIQVWPDPHDPCYPVNEETGSWDLKSVSIEKQILVCEALRVKNEGEGWSLYDDNTARWCTVYEVIISEPDDDFTVRGIVCNASVSNKTIVAAGGLTPTKLHPRFSPTSSPSSWLNRTSENNHTTWNPTPSPSTRAHRRDNLYLLILLVIPLLLLLYVLFLRRRCSVKGRIQKKGISFSNSTNNKAGPGERKRVSGQTSLFSSIHYLNPFSKKSTVPSEREYFLQEEETSK